MLADIINNLARQTGAEGAVPFSLGTPKQGSLLFSAPFLPDPNFARSVMLLVEHNQEGTIGFMLSRPLINTMAELLPELAAFDGTVFGGGPVEPKTLHYVHRMPELPEAKEIAPGLFWGGNFDTLRRWVDAGIANEQNTLFFVGYSGWAEGQLQTEMEEDTWISLPAKATDLWPNHGLDDAYQQLLGPHGPMHRLLSNMPSHPQWN